VNSSGGLTWYLDYNGNGIWDGTAIDRMYVSTFGSPGDILITGDWNDDGKTEIGIVKPNPTQTGLDWYLDCNGNGILDNDPNIDCIYLSN
ncbi:MAG: hypothetical protein Q8L10_01970, partial [Candidatus Moranbacteria bacterium]|nr:hypothetical protein [Candidatus Moranbacteria bacterium]